MTDFSAPSSSRNQPPSATGVNNAPQADRVETTKSAGANIKAAALAHFRSEIQRRRRKFAAQLKKLQRAIGRLDNSEEEAKIMEIKMVLVILDYAASWANSAG